MKTKKKKISVERRRLNTPIVSLMQQAVTQLAATEKSNTAVSEILKTYSADRSRIDHLETIVGKDETSGLQGRQAKTEEIVCGNPNEKIVGLVDQVRNLWIINSLVLAVSTAFGLLMTGLHLEEVGIWMKSKSGG